MANTGQRDGKKAHHRTTHTQRGDAHRESDPSAFRGPSLRASERKRDEEGETTML